MKKAFCLSYTGWGLLIVGLTAMACGPKPAARESVLDTPQAAYDRGQRALAASDIVSAQTEFIRAQRLDPKFAPADEGLGLVRLAQGNRIEAKKLLEMAKTKDKTYAPAWIGMGRVYDADKKFEDALGEFREALKRDTGRRWAKTTQYYTGQTYEHQGNFALAQEAYAAALALDPGYAQADQAWKRLNETQRTMAGASPEYQTIARAAAVTRAELAALLVNELPLDRIFQKRDDRRETPFQAPGATRQSGQPNQIPDTQTSWAKAYVDRTVAVGAMELYPDGQFKPTETITRVELAQVVQNILIATFHDPKLATAYIGNTSTLSDVPRSHFAFNAVTLAVSRGIMAPKADGTFGLADTVSGTEALQAIRSLKNLSP